MSCIDTISSTVYMHLDGLERLGLSIFTWKLNYTVWWQCNLYTSNRNFHHKYFKTLTASQLYQNHIWILIYIWGTILPYCGIIYTMGLSIVNGWTSVPPLALKQITMVGIPFPIHISDPSIRRVTADSRVGLIYHRPQSDTTCPLRTEELRR